MAISRLETDRLILRKFESSDMEALYLLLKEEEVNTFLPWFPMKSMEETKDFYVLDMEPVLLRKCGSDLDQVDWRVCSLHDSGINHPPEG